MRVVIHKQIYKERPGGWSINTTLCGRMALGDDGMNVGKKVTCKLCLKKLKR